MNYNKKLLVFLLLFCIYNLKSQNTESFYVHYLTDNYYLLHPALAGASSLKVRVNAQRQWLNQNNTPSFETFTINGKINNTKNGIGVILFNDSNGFSSQKGVFASYAYHINLQRDRINYLNQFSFGITAGLIEYKIDESSFSTTDPIINGGILSNRYYNLDFGFAYNYKSIHAQLTLKDLIETREQEQQNIIYEKKTRIILSGGYFFGESENKNFYYEPSALLQYNPYSQEKRVDINFKVYYNLNAQNRVWEEFLQENTFGANTDSSKSLTIITSFIGIEVRRFLFSYLFGTPINNISFTTESFHQIGIGYNFQKDRSKEKCECYVKSIL